MMVEVWHLGLVVEELVSFLEEIYGIFFRVEDFSPKQSHRSYLEI